MPIASSHAAARVMARSPTTVALSAGRVAAALRGPLHQIDRALAGISLSARIERPSLLAFLFHGVFSTAKQIELGHMDPQQHTTVEVFERFLDYFLEHDYQFVSPDDLVVGLRPDVKYVLATFDDGYFNNSLVLPALKSRHVPAVFFISTNHVIEGRPFWWDVVYRERSKQGTSLERIGYEKTYLKRFKAAEIEAYLRSNFGKRALRPIGDVDRPISVTELRAFSAEPEVFIGNHTRDHAILTNYNGDELREQIEGAQADLQAITGRTPIVISYPNGNASDETVTVSADAGLQFGISVRPTKNSLPFDVQNSAHMRLARFVIPRPEVLEEELTVCRSDIGVSNLIRRWRQVAY